MQSGAEATEDVVEPEEEMRPVLSYWQEKLLINLIELPAINQLTPQLQQQVPHVATIKPLTTFKVRFAKNGTAFYPPIFWNHFWSFKYNRSGMPSSNHELRSDMRPINQTTPSLVLNITIAPLSAFKWQLFTQVFMRVISCYSHCVM